MEVTPTNNAAGRREVRGRIQSFIGWLDAFGDTSQDQFDFWASPFGIWAKRSYYRNKWIGAPLVAPLVFLDTCFPQLRSLARQRQRFPIADAHYAIGFFALMEREHDRSYGQRAERYLDALLAQRCEAYLDYCWGYPFDWETCFGTFWSGVPLVTTIPYCYEAFEAGYESTGATQYLRIMESVAKFAHENLPEVEVSPGVFACSYSPIDSRRVINANAYRAFLLIAAGKRFGNRAWLDRGEGNLRFVLHCQQLDGGWLYAADGKDQFIDNFHTCFVLKNLVKVWRMNGDPDVLSAIQRGYQFYKERLLDGNGLPKPFARTQRINLIKSDLYDYAEGINLALLIREIDPEASIVLSRLLSSLFRDWVLPDGHFVTRKTRVGRNSVPYHRWGQSQLFCALVHCYLEMS